MNLARHLAVIKRFKWVVAGGLVFAVLLAVLAAYKPGGAGLERRGSTSFSSQSSIFVTQAGFPWGRITLPETDASGAAAPTTTDEKSGSTTTPTNPDNSRPFGSPARFTDQAILFSVIAASDQIRKTLPGPPSADQVKAVAFDYTGNGNAFQPIIQITTTAATSGGAQKLNQQVIDALRKWLTTEQSQADIADNERVELSVLNKPSDPLMIDGPTMTPSLLAFFLVCLATLALVHILEAIRPRAGTDPQQRPTVVGLDHEHELVDEEDDRIVGSATAGHTGTRGSGGHAGARASR